MHGSLMYPLISLSTSFFEILIGIATIYVHERARVRAREIDIFFCHTNRYMITVYVRTYVQSPNFQNFFLDFNF